MKKIFLIFFAILPYCLLAQDNGVKKIVLEFNFFKYPNTEYRINYKKNELTCIMKYRTQKNKIKVIFNKTYKFTEKEFEKTKIVLEQEIPDSIITKSEAARDGGGFEINYFRKNKKKSKLIVQNPKLNPNKFIQELKKIDSFFEFAYTIVKDSAGIKNLDLSYRPFYTKLPIRKVSENPLEYKVWGRINGNASLENNFLPFLESLPKDKCVIIDCDNQLSYAWQEDILRLYILKNTNLRFANMDWLKHTRENLLELKEKFKTIRNNEIELNNLKNTTTYELYTLEIDNSLESPEKQVFSKIEEFRKKCQ